LDPNTDKSVGGSIRSFRRAVRDLSFFAFLVSEYREMEAMHGSWFGLLVAALVALGFAVFGVLVSLYLLRYSFRENKPN
jgi:hypothetical protein